MKLKNPLFISLTGFALSLSCAYAETIYSHDFSGDTTDLNGVTPDVTTDGAMWVAANNIDSNGDVNQTDLLSDTPGTVGDSGAGSATLAFAPVDGYVYTAEGSLSITSGGVGDWGGFGFANGQLTVQATANRFTFQPDIITEGRAWMTYRASNNRTFLTGTDGNTGWSDLGTGLTDLDLRIVLDTTGGTGAWTATWYAKDTASSSFTEVRGSTIIDEDITSVGFSASGDEITYSIKSFSLTAVSDGPASWAGYTITDGYVDTGSFMGSLYVVEDPWIYSVDLGDYIYLPESSMSTNGAWVNVPK